MDGRPHLVGDELGVVAGEPPQLDAPLRATHDRGEGVAAVLAVHPGQRESADRGSAEHHGVQMGIVHSVAPVRAAECRHVRDRVVGLAYAGEVILEPGEPLVHHFTYEPAHSAEMRVDRHGGAAGLGRDPPGGQRLRAFVEQQPRGDVDENRPYGGVGPPRAHDSAPRCLDHRRRRAPPGVCAKPVTCESHPVMATASRTPTPPARCVRRGSAEARSGIDHDY